MNKPVMRPAWRNLLFLHWEIPADELRALLPPGLELDTFDGRAYVGLVPFTMTGVRPRGLPFVPDAALWENFHETNVRTYVRHRVHGPGVWFFSLDAANPLAVVAARAWFKLPYHHAAMSLRQRGDVLEYASKRRWPDQLPGACQVRCRPLGTPAPAAPGSLEEFLVERYALYSQAHGRLFVGRVRHKPYQVQPAEVLELRESLVAAAGIALPENPPLAHYSAGVRTEIFGLELV